jgi:hypothetical protein
MKPSLRAAATLVPIAILLLAGIAGIVAPANADSGDGSGNRGNLAYNSVISPLPGNLPSVGGEAYAFSEFGNAVNFAGGSSRSLTKVLVTLSSWRCAAGGWTTNNCVTPEDAKFSVPITVNIYNPSTDGGLHPGARITTLTKIFDIPFRPSASANCTGKQVGKWYQNSTKSCFNGLATNISFKFDGVTVPNSAIVGIAYNTTHFGYAPIGESAACFMSSGGCGYDSLNIALSEDPTNVTSGSSVDLGKIWQNSSVASEYCDTGTAGVGTFRVDSPNSTSCWGANAPSDTAPYYVPAIQIIGSSIKGDEKGDNKIEDNDHSNQGKDLNQAGSDHSVKKD